MPSIQTASIPVTSFPNEFVSPWGNDEVIPLYSSVPLKTPVEGCLPCVVCGNSIVRAQILSSVDLPAESKVTLTTFVPEINFTLKGKCKTHNYPSIYPPPYMPATGEEPNSSLELANLLTLHSQKGGIENYEGWSISKPINKTLCEEFVYSQANYLNYTAYSIAYDTYRKAPINKKDPCPCCTTYFYTNATGDRRWDTLANWNSKIDCSGDMPTEVPWTNKDNSTNCSDLIDASGGYLEISGIDVPNTEITIEVTGTTYNVTTDNSGNWTLGITALSCTIYTIEIGTASIEVGPASPIISAIINDGQLIVKGTIFAQNAPITIVVNGESHELTTNKRNVWTYTQTADEGITYTIEVNDSSLVIGPNKSKVSVSIINTGGVLMIGKYKPGITPTYSRMEIDPDLQVSGFCNISYITAQAYIYGGAFTGYQFTLIRSQDGEIYGGDFYGDAFINRDSKISGGNFSGDDFENRYAGVITGGLFTGNRFTHSGGDYARIDGGTFTGDAFINNGRINGGLFTSPNFTNNGSGSVQVIRGGTFENGVFTNNHVIKNGIFTAVEFNNHGNIDNGTFSIGEFTNSAVLYMFGRINGGTWTGDNFTNNRIINGGTFDVGNFTNLGSVGGNSIFYGQGFRINNGFIVGGTFYANGFVNPNGLNSIGGGTFFGDDAVNEGSAHSFTMIGKRFVNNGSVTYANISGEDCINNGTMLGTFSGPKFVNASSGRVEYSIYTDGLISGDNFINNGTFGGNWAGTTLENAGYVCAPTWPCHQQCTFYCK